MLDTGPAAGYGGEEDDGEYKKFFKEKKLPDWVKPDDGFAKSDAIWKRDGDGNDPMSKLGALFFTLVAE